MLATVPATRRSGETLAAPERRCPYCCADIPRESRKCRTCGEWVVGTSGGLGAVALRLLALLWAALTLLAVAGLWTLGQGVRRWVWLHAVDPTITPQVVDIVLYAVIAIVLLKGLMLSVGLGVIARLSPRRPRWWT
jgi:hypothetical protein